MYKPENQSWIGSLIQKIWSENQGHLTLHIFQKNLLSCSFHLHSISPTHSISFHFHFIFIIILTPFSFHSISSIKSPFRTIFIQLFSSKLSLCKSGGVVSVSAAGHRFRSWNLFPQLETISTASITLFSK